MPKKTHSHTAKSCPSGDLHLLTFERLYKTFENDIERKSMEFPLLWREDCCQEGAIALYESHQKFILLPPGREFRPYALTAIEYRMIDFYRKHVERAPKTDNVTVTNEESESVDYITTITDDLSFVTTTTFGLDYEIVFNETNLKICGFNENEVQAFSLSVVQDLQVRDVAEKMYVSIGQASKIISRTKEKTVILIKNFLEIPSPKK